MTNSENLVLKGQVVTMSLFRLRDFSAHLLVILLAVVAADSGSVQETTEEEGRLHFKSATLQQHYGRTAGFTVPFAKELNRMLSMADLASLLVPEDRRFCSIETFQFLNESKTAASNVTRWQQSMVKLRQHCVRKQRGGLIAVEGLRKQELVTIDHARLEAEKVSCKPRVVHLELPPAPFGTWYYPHCVTAKRCGGCCPSALLECRPTNITIVKKRVMKFQEESKIKYDNIQSFAIEQHKRCECGCKTLASHCSKMQVYDEESCECKCVNDSEIKACRHPKEWDQNLCSCGCPQSLVCSTGAYIHPDSCKCISGKNSKQSREKNRY